MSAAVTKSESRNCSPTLTPALLGSTVVEYLSIVTISCIFPLSIAKRAVITFVRLAGAKGTSSFCATKISPLSLSLITKALTGISYALSLIVKFTFGFERFKSLLAKNLLSLTAKKLTVRSIAIPIRLMFTLTLFDFKDSIMQV